MTRNQVFSNLESKYATWLSGLKQNGFSAANHYVANLKAIGEPIAAHTANTAKWNGLFELLTGIHPAKGVFEVTSVAEFASIYGAAVSFFTAEKGEKEQIRPRYPNCRCFDDLFDFAFQNGNATSLGDGGHTRNGFVKYCQFLCELETQVQNGSDDQPFQMNDEPWQMITYGAPGTGKSFATDGKLIGGFDNQKILSFRTTFHPDSDYSTFVGAYKPTMDEAKKIVYQFRPQAFMNAYVAAWKEAAKGAGGKVKTDNVKRPYSGLNAVMVSVVNAFIAEGGNGVVKSRKEIIDKAIEFSDGAHSDQSFVPSDYCYNRVNGLMTLTRPALFEYLGNGKYKCLGADDTTYNGDILWQEKGSDVEKVVGKCTAGKRELKADEPGKSVVLVIEEINRGNCAQIFGDLFQLLDRDDNGFSKYPIISDDDVRRFLVDDVNGFGKARKTIGVNWPRVARGEELVLPGNFYIWATMNTSDQSLFPIDSAFKRRWDWEYVPIKRADKKPEKEWIIKVAHDGKTYWCYWWEFLEAINHQIEETTHSEDKQLGYFFAKPKAGEDFISTDTFVNKVIFYLWNDVFKDYGFEKDIFNDTEGKLSFGKFYHDNGEIQEDKVELFLKNLAVEVLDDSNAMVDKFDDSKISNEQVKNERKESLVSVTINGKRFDKSNCSAQFDIYLSALREIGINRVAPLIMNMKYHREGKKMASSTTENLNNSNHLEYIQAGNYYFLKGIKSYTLIRILEDLKPLLDGVDLQIEYK